MAVAFADSARLIEIVGLNLMLSGDNAIMVGLAIHKLPAAHRRIISVAGVTVAVMLQIAATLTVASLLRLPLVSCVGGILLVWIAIRLLQDNSEVEQPVDGHGESLPYAMVTVVFAYLVMCLDNILAIAAVGQDHPALLAVGLTMSCVLLIPGSLVIAELMKRYPMLVRIGAGVLGWTGGTMVAAALPVFGDRFSGPMAQFLVPALTAVTVVSSPSWWPANHQCDAAGGKRRSCV